MSSAGRPTADRPPAELPFIDEHSIDVNASRERVWDTLVETVLPRFGGGWGRLGTGRFGRAGARLLAAPYPDPSVTCSGAPQTIVGFHVERAERPSLILLAGEHRFAAYTLTLSIAGAEGDSKSRLTAQTRAAFPGGPGRLYRAAVIGTSAHVVVVRRLLHRVRRLAERGGKTESPA
jgi:hypothetical protein